MTSLTVTVVTGVDVSLQRFSLCELGQHFRQMAGSLSSRLPAITVIPLRELQGQIPERLHGVGAMIAGQARHLQTRGRGIKTRAVLSLSYAVSCLSYCLKTRKNKTPCGSLL